MTLTPEEAVATLAAADALAEASWAEPVLTRARATLDNLRVRLADAHAGRPVNADERGLLFEIRYAAMLHRAGVAADYEIEGVNDTTIDFGVARAPGWRIELVSLGSSDAIKSATIEAGLFSEMMLETPPVDATRRQLAESEEGELIKAQERIGEKVLRTGKPVKFPEPDGRVHILMVDGRGVLDGTSDANDWIQIVRGAQNLPEHMVRCFPPGRPIIGLFEPTCPLRASATLRERVHVIGVVCEQSFEPDEIARRTIYFRNEELLKNAGLDDALAAWAKLAASDH